MGCVLKLRLKFAGDGKGVKRNQFHIKAVGLGDPPVFAGTADPAKFKLGDRIRVRDLPAMFYTRTPEYVRGAEGIIAEVA